MQVWPFTLPRQSLTSTPGPVGKPPEQKTSSVCVVVAVVHVVVGVHVGASPVKISCWLQEKVLGSPRFPVAQSTWHVSPGNLSTQSEASTLSPRFGTGQLPGSKVDVIVEVVSVVVGTVEVTVAVWLVAEVVMLMVTVDVVVADDIVLLRVVEMV